MNPFEKIARCEEMPLKGGISKDFLISLPGRYTICNMIHLFLPVERHRCDKHHHFTQKQPTYKQNASSKELPFQSGDGPYIVPPQKEDLLTSPLMQIVHA